jgi:hypothetical protein
MAYYLFNFVHRPGAGRRTSESLMSAARGLLELRLWGIPVTAPHRWRLATGDEMVAYVGAPAESFVGCATLAGGWHQWASEEGARYHGEFRDGGVAFSAVELWERGLPISVVLPQLNLHPPPFRRSVEELSGRDYEEIVRAGRQQSQGP